MTWEMDLQNFFLDVVNLSITASWVITAVLLLRLLLKPVPKKYVCLLWFVVLIRLLCPVTVESEFGFVPWHEPVQYEIVYITPQIETQSEIVNAVADLTVNPMLEATSAPNPTGSVNPLQIYLFVVACIWVIGMVLLCGYTLISWFRLRRRLSEAVPDDKQIYWNDRISSPFVFGIVKPKIYLPRGLRDDERHWVLLHEQSHIARKDHIVKPIFWLAVMLHWMNPLVWAAWHCYSRDVELACDERAIDTMRDDEKRQYSHTLVQLATEKRQLRCPVAFSNNSVKQRIKRVLEYKKLPALALDLILIFVLVFGGCLLLNQGDRPLEQWDKQLIEEGKLESDYEISSVLIQWGSVSTEITDKEEIARLKQELDAMQVRPLREWMPQWYQGGCVSFFGSDGGILANSFEFQTDCKVLTGTVTAGSLKVKDPEALQALLLPYCKELLQQYPETTFYADLNHDGEEESIVVNVSMWEGGFNEAWLTVYEKDGTILLNRFMNDSHGGWDSYFLLERDGKDYLVEFLPTMYQGNADYWWNLMDFDKNNELRFVESDSVTFSINPQQFDFDVNAIYDFMEGAERVIRPAMLLVSTDNGVLRYSTVEEYQTLTAERFIRWWLEDNPDYLALSPEEQETLSLKEKLQMKQNEIY